MSPIIHLVIGATASGKSAYALSLAKELNGIIINADSQQIYKDIKILSARPSCEEEALVPHALYGIATGDDKISVGYWLKLVEMEISWALQQKITPIVTGGTGLYIKALIEGIAEIPEISAEIKTQAENDLQEMGKQAFFERLMAVDEKSAKKIGPNNTQRLIRAYSVWLGTAKPLSYWHAQGNKPIYPREYFKIHHIELPRSELYRRCDLRFTKMLEAGAVEEVSTLNKMYNNLIPDPLLKIIGVSEILEVIRGSSDLDLAKEKATQATRNYAKRQLTWFRNQL